MAGRSALAFLAGLLVATPALAVGESTSDGFPNWAERVMHEWTNRARVDPQLEMTQCGAPCGEKACYSPLAPVYYLEGLNRAARFHSDEMVKQGYFAHDSACTVVNNIASIWPASCDGSASCACVGGTQTCSPTCSSFSARVKLFGPSGTGEIIASSTDPNSAFYQWLYENSSSTTCAFSQANGHRWLLLKSTGAVGFGSTGRSVGDFSGGGTAYAIPSGSHYPRQAATVDAGQLVFRGGPQAGSGERGWRLHSDEPGTRQRDERRLDREGERRGERVPPLLLRVHQREQCDRDLSVQWVARDRSGGQLRRLEQHAPSDGDGLWRVYAPVWREAVWPGWL